MRKFHNILYVTNGTFDETEGLKQALKLAGSNRITLHVLLVYPGLPKNQQEYTRTYEKYLTEQVNAALQETRVMLNMEHDRVSFHMVQGGGDVPPAIHVIRHVLRNAHDLVIKEAEPRKGGKGFRSIDMTLLRKCPCPVWLAHPVTGSRGDTHVAVAVDPENREEAERALSLRLLELSRSMADNLGGSLSILSCWDYVFEQFLRYKAWTNVSEDELAHNIEGAEADHLALLNTLVDESGIGTAHQVHHMRGGPDTLIPEFVEKQSVDILVMGTVARTGIIGFLIGNTAENIVTEISCSLMALKPAGFISPVKAY